MRCLQVQAGATRRLMSVHGLGSPRTLLSYGSYGAYSVGQIWGQVLASRWLQVGGSAWVCACVCTAVPLHSMAAHAQSAPRLPTLAWPLRLPVLTDCNLTAWFAGLPPPDQLLRFLLGECWLLVGFECISRGAFLSKQTAPSALPGHS